MGTVYNIKNKAKLLYSLAIANIVKKHYRTAKSYIDECISINHEDGYQSGELFAYMAQAYLDYALNGTVSDKTQKQIEQLLVRNNVYTFFRLQLAIIKEDQHSINRISHDYDWIDFSCTVKECRRFLSQLKKS